MVFSTKAIWLFYTPYCDFSQNMTADRGKIKYNNFKRSLYEFYVTATMLQSSVLLGPVICVSVLSLSQFMKSFPHFLFWRKKNTAKRRAVLANK
jgi:hypothetical protein